MYLNKSILRHSTIMTKKYIKDENPSTLRKKTKKLENSRDKLKEKNREKQDSIKALKTRLKETKGSREQWKIDCLRLSTEVDICKEKINTLEQELIKERLEKDQLMQDLENKKKRSH